MTVAELSAWTGGRYSPDALRRAIRNRELVASNAPGPGGKPSYTVRLAAWIRFLQKRRFDPDRVRRLEAVLARVGAGQDDDSGTLPPAA